MENIKQPNNIKNIFKGIMISIIVTCILLLVLSAILTYTSVDENIIKPAIIIITGISILIGSSICNLKIKKRGILNGTIVGGTYLILIYVLSSILNSNFALNMGAVTIMLIGMGLGIIGGILGVNKK